MATITKSAPRAATIKADAAPRFNGVTAEARSLAFAAIAPNAYAEGMSRAATIANLSTALGAVPKGFDPKAAQHPKAHNAFVTLLARSRVEWLAGRACARMPVGEFPKECADTSDRLDYARQLVTSYAAPPAGTDTKRKLRDGKVGYRSVTQHKVIRAAEEAWSQVLAELSLGTAKPQATKNAGRITRSTKATPVRGALAASAPTKEELQSKPSAKMTADEAHAYVEKVAADLLAFANGKQGAALLCTDYGAAIQGFKTAINNASNARALRKAAKEAGEHNK